VSFRCRPLLARDVDEVASWRYPEPYAAYDPWRDPERLERMRQGLPYAALDDGSGLAAFYCTGSEARAARGSYGADAVDFALFVRPDLAGRGHGPHLAEVALEDVARRHPGRPVRVTVAASNPRALRLARRVGFRDIGTFGGFRHGVEPHVVLLRPAAYTGGGGPA
jgi:ribosomal-protein-alanine N-acetyltransferase